MIFPHRKKLHQAMVEALHQSEEEPSLAIVAETTSRIRAVEQYIEYLLQLKRPRMYDIIGGQNATVYKLGLGEASTEGGVFYMPDGEKFVLDIVNNGEMAKILTIVRGGQRPSEFIYRSTAETTELVSNVRLMTPEQLQDLELCAAQLGRLAANSLEKSA